MFVFSALYVKCPYDLPLYMQSVLIIPAFYVGDSASNSSDTKQHNQDDEGSVRWELDGNLLGEIDAQVGASECPLQHHTRECRKIVRLWFVTPMSDPASTRRQSGPLQSRTALNFGATLPEPKIGVFAHGHGHGVTDQGIRMKDFVLASERTYVPDLQRSYLFILEAKESEDECVEHRLSIASCRRGHTRILTILDRNPYATLHTGAWVQIGRGFTCSRCALAGKHTCLSVHLHHVQRSPARCWSTTCEYTRTRQKSR